MNRAEKAPAIPFEITGTLYCSSTLRNYRAPVAFARHAAISSAKSLVFSRSFGLQLAHIVTPRRAPRNKNPIARQHLQTSCAAGAGSFRTIMHFAFPPRKSSHPPPYAARSSRSRYLRYSRLQVVAAIAIGAIVTIYILSTIFSGSSAPSIPAGTPKAVIVTPLDPSLSESYKEAIKANRRHYAHKHGKREKHKSTCNRCTRRRKLILPPRLCRLLPKHNRLPLGRRTLFLVDNPRHPPRHDPLPRLDLRLLPDLDRADHVALAIPRTAHHGPKATRKPDAGRQTRRTTGQRHQDLRAPQRRQNRLRADPRPRRTRGRKHDPAKRRLGPILPRRLVRPLIPQLQLPKSRGPCSGTHSAVSSFPPILQFSKLPHFCCENIKLTQRTPRWHGTILAKLALIPQRILNSYTTGPAEGIYNEGDFIANFHGCQRDAARNCEEESQHLMIRWREITDRERQ